MPSHCLHDCACACMPKSERITQLVDELNELRVIISQLKKENELLKSSIRVLMSIKDGN